MNGFLLGLRGDLRLALRPACLLVLVGTVTLSGLLSATMQDAAYLQRGASEYTAEQRPWLLDSCDGSRTACRRQREVAAAQAAETVRFERRDTVVVARLQTADGAVAYAAAFMALGTGAVVLALLVTLTFCGEWVRGTLGLALSGGVTPTALALRRWSASCILGGGALLAAAIGALAAARWGAAARPLGGVVDGSGLPAVLGAVVVIVFYAGLASAVAWWARAGMRTLVIVLGAVGALAMTTPLGALAPGAWIASAVGVDRVLELEIGYLWVWPGLTFTLPGLAAHLVAVPPWAVGVGALVLLTGALVAALGLLAARTDPLGT